MSGACAAAQFRLYSNGMKVSKLGLVGILATSVYAQTFRGNLSGNVTDSSGAALPLAVLA
jgi:hypothetical protein